MGHEFSNTPAASGTRVGPRTASSSQSPRLKAVPYFLLMHHPMGWEACEVEGRGLCWVPRLKKLPITPGSNGVRQGRAGGSPDASLAIANQTSRGWRFIPEDYDGGFVDRYEATGGVVYLLKFESIKTIGNRSVVRCDDAAYNAWRLGLVENGVIPAPEPEVLEDLMDRQRSRISRHQKHIHIPAVAAKLEAETAKLDTMEALSDEAAA